MSGTQPAQNDGEPWWVKPALAGAVIAAMVITIVLATFYVDDKTLKITMFTTVGAGFLTAINFYFGGAASAAKKDDTIATIASAAVPATTAPAITAANTEALNRNTAATTAGTTATDDNTRATDSNTPKPL